MRAALGWPRRRPKAASSSCRAAIAASGVKAVSTTATAFRNGGSVGSGQAAERQSRERRTTFSPAPGSAESAASISSPVP